MKLFVAARSYEPLVYLKKLQLPYNKLRDIREIRKMVEPEAEMCQEEEKKLLEQYAVKDKSGNPVIHDDKISFSNIEDKDAFLRKYSELHDMDIDIKFSPVSISDEEMGSQSISEEYIERLRGFVDIGRR